MSTDRLLALGTFTPKDLQVSVSESTRKIDPEIEKQIDAIWEEKQAQAMREGRVCYNGISYRLNALEKEGEKLRIDFGLLEYRARQALSVLSANQNLPEKYRHYGCYTAATVRTADDTYLVVELSGRSMNMNKLDMPGGIMEKPQEIESGEDVFNALYTELREEARIQKGDIETLYLRAVFNTFNAHTCFYFEAKLNVSSEELLARFADEERDQDISSLKALSKEEYLTFLATQPSPSKQRIAEFVSI